MTPISSAGGALTWRRWSRSGLPSPATRRRPAGCCGSSGSPTSARGRGIPRRTNKRLASAPMRRSSLAIDLGKRSFHLYGIDTDGVILSQKVSRTKLAEVVDNIAPKAIAMEACASSHYWARCWVPAGHEVRLINPRFVKPFVKGSKNDAVDAEAIFEAGMSPTMRFVPVRSTDQQYLQSLHRARDRLIGQTDCVDQPYTRRARRVWNCAPARLVAVYGPGSRRYRRQSV